MAQVSVLPMQWAALKDIMGVRPLSDADSECLMELRGVLAKYNSLGRFGITLLHKHFDVNENEILVEYPDGKARRLVVEIEKADKFESHNSIPTSWSLETGQAVARCVCARVPDSHLGYHRKA